VLVGRRSKFFLSLLGGECVTDGTGRIDGTYVDKSGVSLLKNGGTQILATHDSIYGPGGQDVFTVGDGPILVYHYYTSSGSYVRPFSLFQRQ
jgi:hypothetical protein